jgi:NADPH-dependent curcumin reductase CurA
MSPAFPNDSATDPRDPAAGGATVARRVVLVAPIAGAPQPSDFRLDTYSIPAPADGQFLVRNVWCSVDPGTRSRLSAGVSYTTPLAAGEMITSFALGRVLASRHAGYAPGDWIVHASGWTDHQLCDGRGYLQKLDPAFTGADGAPPAVPLTAWIGVLGIPGMTAWFGLERVGALKAGDRVLVSSAAGAVGASAGQIARKLGAARVVGIAGGPTKCGWLERDAHFDATVDYKAAQAGAPDGAEATRRLQAALQAASPDGYDLLFDNVGNAMIDAVIPLLRPHARIVVSGTVAEYNTPPGQVHGLVNTRHFIARRLRMEGILVFDDRKQFARAQAEIAGWIARGEFAWREERFEGIERLPEAFCGLFSGQNFGRRVVRVSAD